jgi:hypothetical protein
MRAAKRHRAQNGGTRGKDVAAANSNPCSVLAAGTKGGSVGFVFGRSHFDVDDEGPRPAIRTLRGWAISVLLEAGAIRECEEHGWMQDRTDPHARERALVIARQEPPCGFSPEQAVAEVRNMLESVGDTCPECPRA